MVKAVRGAVKFAVDEKEKIKSRIQYLVSEIVSENSIEEEKIISIIFSVTKDLRSINPAAALRAGGGFNMTPLFCSQEPETDGAMTRVVRVLVTFERNDNNKRALKYIYIDGAEKLRPDLK